MDKTIEKKFFEAFKWGGVVDKCISWMRYTYNLPKMKPSNNGDNDEKQQSEETGKEDEKWDKFYREVLPKEILEATEAFDDAVIKYMDSPLMDEIEANLNECSTDTQRERYLFSLLKPFGENGCDFANTYNPVAEITHLKDEIKELERTKDSWQTMQKNEPFKNDNIEHSGAYKEQIEACDGMIRRNKEQIDWVLHVSNEFFRLTSVFEDGTRWMQAGTVENCLNAFCHVVDRFANRLDALLLTYGIDLMKLQKESGLYLKNHRIITDIDCYIGSMELTKRYIDALPQEPNAASKQDIAEPQPKQKQGFSKPQLKHLKQQQRSLQARGKGRPKETLKEKMINDADGSKLQKVHTVMNGKKGKDAALIVIACIKKGWMQKPTFTQVKEEFGDIGTQQGFTKYLNESCFAKDEIEGAINSLD